MIIRDLNYLETDPKQTPAIHGGVEIRKKTTIVVQKGVAVAKGRTFFSDIDGEAEAVNIFVRNGSLL